MSQRGFTLLEMLIAAAIAVLLGSLTLFCVHALLGTSATLAARFSDQAQIGALVDRLEADEDSAWAIFVPPQDVFGASNADGHEVDFFTRDGQGRAAFWAYRYDASAKPAPLLQRYSYASPGGSAVAQGSAITGITAFSAHTYPITALADASSPLYSPLYAGAQLHAGAVRFFPQSAPWIAGGNQVTLLHVQTAEDARALNLSTQTAPSGFTVVLRYTPPPTGPLISLGSITFAPSAIAYNAPAQRLARAINRVLGGRLARAAGTACSYAQLTLQSGAPDANAPNASDPYNTADGNGCVTNGAVYLWASEANYPSSQPFGAQNPTVGGCLGFINTSAQMWYPGRSVLVTATAATPRCTVDVVSNDDTIANGKAVPVAVAVQANNGCKVGTPCIALGKTVPFSIKVCSPSPTLCKTKTTVYYPAIVAAKAYSLDGGQTWTIYYESGDNLALFQNSQTSNFNTMLQTCSGAGPGGITTAYTGPVSPLSGTPHYAAGTSCVTGSSAWDACIPATGSTCPAGGEASWWDFTYYAAGNGGSWGSVQYDS